MDEHRIERDSMGEILVPKNRHWGAQTQRSLDYFRIGQETMPLPVIYALTRVKKACALANMDEGRLSREKGDAICEACDEILAGLHDGEFPLCLWQTGSGTQTNMNVNEVIAHLGMAKNPDMKLHPNDDVNRSQSSNDVFPTAMHIAAIYAADELAESAERLREVFAELSREYSGMIKAGRTHLQDATPLTLGQEIGAWEGMLARSIEMLKSAREHLAFVPLGGTAVGTGLNAGRSFTMKALAWLCEVTELRLFSSENKFASMTSKNELVFTHGAVKALACDLFKIANDVRLLSSGPRNGIGEIRIPENEPGSSIMPGKVNPTQSEALCMVAVQVMGNDSALSFAASQGHYQLNVFMPLIISNFIRSCRLLSDAVRSFTDHCAAGITANENVISRNLNRSLMTVTALTPVIGYDACARAAKYALDKDIDLKAACLELGLCDEAAYDNAMDYRRMVFEE